MFQKLRRRRLAQLRLLKRYQDEDPCNDPDRVPPVREEPQGVWLVVRYDLADAGARPIPDGDVFWYSPDIWITGGDALGNAIAGKPTGVHARVWNLGNFPATPTRIDFSFVDPSIGVPWHAPQLIGTAWTSLPALSAVQVTCPNQWIPAETGSTHACLLATCSHSFLDPATAPNNPRQDRHAGQRNVTIVEQAAGAKFQFQLRFAPTAGLARTQLFANVILMDGVDTTQLVADQALQRALFDIDIAGNRTTRRLISRRAGLLGGMVRSGQALPADQLQQRLQFQTDDSVTTQATHVKALATQVVPVIEFAEFEHAPDQPELVALGGEFRPRDLAARTLDLTFVRPAHRGDVQLQIWQVEDGVVAGGYTVVFKGKAGPDDPNQGDDNVMTVDDKNLEHAVIQAHPAARATFEMSQQLSNYMPFQSRDELVAKLGDNVVKVCGAKITARQIEHVLPADVFPIRNQVDLVEKVSAAIRVGVELIRQTCVTPEDENLSQLAALLASEPATHTPRTAAGYFSGPSLFGAGRKEEDC